MNPALRPLVLDPERSAILLDFDGSLSEIVARPELATPVAGAREVVQQLARRFGLVAVISGRATEEVRRLLGADGVRYAGHYGLENEPAELPKDAFAQARAIASVVPHAWVERKVSSLPVHYRQAPHPEEARRILLAGLEPIAREFGLEVLEGKMVIELVPRGRPRKGEAVGRLVLESGARAALFAGDDLADLEAFEALDNLRERGIHAVKVAVRGLETPDELTTAADVVAEGPAGMVALLRELVS